MNNMMKLTIAMLLCMAALIGPSVALNPGELDMGSCPDEGFATGLLFGPYESYPEYQVDVGLDGIMDLTVNGISFWIYPDGGVQYIGEPLQYGAERGFQYYIIQVDENGTEIDRHGHFATVDIAPCETCPAFVEANSDTSELDGSYVYFTTLPNSKFVDGDGNGDWRSKPYLWTCDGTEWTSVIYSSSMGLPEGAVLEVRKTNINEPEVLSAYAYL